MPSSNTSIRSLGFLLQTSLEFDKVEECKLIKDILITDILINDILITDILITAGIKFADWFVDCFIR